MIIIGMTFVEGVRQLAHPYYVVNLILSLSYLTFKKFPYLCQYVPLDPESVCELDSRESEILFFLIIVVMIRTRRAGSVTMISYLSSSFMYAKIANMLLWFHADTQLGLIFCVAFVLVGLFFPEPTYSGPQKVTYFKSLDSFQEELERDRSVAWLIEFYTTWSPACTNFAPTFAQISAQYHTSGLRFGKLDLGRSPEASKKYQISDSPTSKALPTLILFQNGKEMIRRPTTDSQGRFQKFFFSEGNIATAFNLNNLYEQSRSRQKTLKKTGTNMKKEE